MSKKEYLRQLPKVDEIVENENLKVYEEKLSRNIVINEIRNEIETVRAKILKDEYQEYICEEKIDTELIIKNISRNLEKKSEMSLKKVINATGTILHTNLGRALISEDIKEHIAEIACNYSTLEYDLEEGKRGSRYTHVEKIITEITGTEAALVVNNNAAAVMLILNTMAKGKKVIVSRGELVEVGGSFRIPEIMEQSGAELKEVGTTNKTHTWDYENAIDEEVGALLKVHTSNYKILGFTEEVDLSDMVKVGKKSEIPVIHDLGSGALIDLKKYDIYDEPTVMDSVDSGADIICFSGDKLLGGPQAGIIIGKKHWIDKMKKNPLTRAFRMDKITLAVLEATFKKYQELDYIEKIPTLKMITMDKAEIKEKIEAIYDGIKSNSEINVEIIEGFSQIGGGSLPLHELSSWVLEIKPKTKTVNEIENILRNKHTPIIVRINNNAILIDGRTVSNIDIPYIIESLQNV